jgi:hypothetical protein
MGCLQKLATGTRIFLPIDILLDIYSLVRAIFQYTSKNYYVLMYLLNNRAAIKQAALSYR